MQTFLGLDLAWHGRGKNSALAVLIGDDERVALSNTFDLTSDDEIFESIQTRSSPDSVLAIDAPLVIKNETGQRECEREIGQLFGHADASAHTANMARCPDARSLRLVSRLEAAGWRHDVDPVRDRRSRGRCLFEVYPHPAHVVLFDRQRIIKYKKGVVAARRAGLEDLRTGIVQHLCCATPALLMSDALQALVAKPLIELGGLALKKYEDSLDALLCAYIAAHYWTWGEERNEMIGTMDAGYIVTPRRTAAGEDWSHPARSAKRPDRQGGSSRPRSAPPLGTRS